MEAQALLRSPIGAATLRCSKLYDKIAEMNEHTNQVVNALKDFPRFILKFPIAHEHAKQVVIVAPVPFSVLDRVIRRMHNRLAPLFRTLSGH